MAMRSGFLDRRPVLVGLVFLGGCLGTLIRSVIAHAWPSRADGVPWGTLAINLVGAFVLATLLELLVHAGPDRGVRRAVRLCIGTGLLGGFTTYSAPESEVDRVRSCGLLTVIPCMSNVDNSVQS